MSRRLCLLFANYLEGFLTPQDLFYVRNHGPVPLVHDEDIPNWEITIEGLGFLSVLFILNG